MTEWVLITMLCMRNCQPQYAEVYPSKEACVAKIIKPETNWALPRHYCVPLTKDKK